MDVKILEIKKEHCPGMLLIGKRYASGPNWGEWWANDWFSKLEANPRHAMNEDAFIGAVRIVNGRPEHWIGMFFPMGTAVPDGFESVEMEETDFAVCFLYAKENSSDFYTMETHEMCLEALKEQGFTRREDSWCFERYQCPRFTTPDEQGNVILDYGISIM